MYISLALTCQLLGVSKIWQQIVNYKKNIV